MLDLDAIGRAELLHKPFDFLLADHTLDTADLMQVRQDFPPISQPGLFPPEALRYGAAFRALLDELASPEFEDVLGQKFGLDLTGRPRMVTIRGQTQSRDGRIHADSADKVLTCLLYLNDQWDQGGGRLRFLRSSDNLEDYVVEIPPLGGSFAAFRVGPASWHGHAPFVGERRSIMINWLRDDGASARNLRRHRISAAAKKWLPGLFGAK
jgi:hypothetical protein